MAIKTVGGFEVEIVSKQVAGERKDIIYLELVRTIDGQRYHNWQPVGLKADGGRKELDAAIAAAPLRKAL